MLTFAPSADRPRPRTTVGAAGDGVPRVAPPRGGPAAVGGAELDVRAATVPPGRNLPGDEVRRGVAVGPRARAELAERADAVSGAGLDVPAGELVLLQVTGAEWDAAEERRPGLVVDAGSLRIVALDTTGGVVLDRSCSANPAHGLPTSVTLPLRTARVALLGGGAAGGHGAASAAGWAAGSTLAQIGGRALIGPGCTIESTTMATTPTRRQGRRVTTGVRPRGHRCRRVLGRHHPAADLHHGGGHRAGARPARRRRRRGRRRSRRRAGHHGRDAG